MSRIVNYVWTLFLVFSMIASLVECQNVLSYPLPRLSIQPNSLSISGLSSGAYFAAQFQVAYSSSIVGSGIFAGGPFYCAQGDFATANAACMKVASMINLNTLQTSIVNFASKGLIDGVENVAKHRVYLFSGTKDYIVFPDIMKKLKEQLINNFKVPESNVVADFGVAASHAMITNNYGAKCDTFGVSH